MAAREDAFYDAADDLSDLHSEASATRLASNTPHHHHASVRWLLQNVPPVCAHHLYNEQYMRWMNGNDDGYRNSVGSAWCRCCAGAFSLTLLKLQAQAKLDEYEAALSELERSSGGPGKMFAEDSKHSFIDSDDRMIPRALAMLQSTQNLVAEVSWLLIVTNRLVTLPPCETLNLYTLVTF